MNQLSSGMHVSNNSAKQTYCHTFVFEGFFLCGTEFKIDHNYSKKAHTAPAMITRTVMARGLIVSELFRFNKVEDRASIFVRHF